MDVIVVNPRSTQELVRKMLDRMDVTAARQYIVDAIPADALFSRKGSVWWDSTEGAETLERMFTVLTNEAKGRGERFIYDGETKRYGFV